MLLVILIYPVAAAADDDDDGRRFTQTHYCVLANGVGVMKLRKTWAELVAHMVT